MLKIGSKYGLLKVPGNSAEVGRVDGGFNRDWADTEAFGEVFECIAFFENELAEKGADFFGLGSLGGFGT